MMYFGVLFIFLLLFSLLYWILFAENVKRKFRLLLYIVGVFILSSLVAILCHFACISRAKRYNTCFRECEVFLIHSGFLPDDRLLDLYDLHFEFVEYKNNLFLLVPWQYDYFGNVEEFDFSLLID